MIKIVKEKVDYEIPHFLLQEPMTYRELYCDECKDEVDDLYDLEGRQLCRECILRATRII